MPANEQTWRNIPRMHRVFAVSGIALFIATIWVFWSDQNREWRDVQTTNVSIDTKMNLWRQEQFQTETAQQTKAEKYEQKLKADALPIDRKHTDEFTELVRKFHADMEAIGDDTRVSYDPDDIKN